MTVISPQVGRSTETAILDRLAIGVLIAVYIVAGIAITRELSDPIVDEPIFATSALEFARSGAIEISNLSAPNAIFDTVWGGLFARALGETYGALRVSTIALTALSAPFMYLLGRNLGGSKRIAIFGTAAYLFAPLAFTLSLTFHTDSHLVALAAIAVAITSNAMVRDNNRVAWLLAGSVFVSFAFLSRPQALVITIATVVIWLVKGPREERVFGAVAALSIPVVTYAAHSMWTAGTGEPHVRSLYSELVASLDLHALLVFGSQSLVEGSLFLGLFTLPFLPLTAPRAMRAISRAPRLAVVVGTALAVIAIGGSISRTGPLHGHSWVTGTGFLAVDRSFLGSRAALPEWGTFALMVCFAASVSALVLALSDPGARREKNTSISFTALVLVGFIGAAFLSPLVAHGRILDRYWLPILPFALALAVAGSGSTRRRLMVPVAIMALMSAVTILGSVDGSRAYRAAADFADDVIAEGVDPMTLEAGASWSAATFGLNDDDPDHLSRLGPFWVKFYAVESEPEFGIILEPLDGYTVLERREYMAILHPGPNYLYFVRRDPDLPFYLRLEDF